MAIFSIHSYRHLQHNWFWCSTRGYNKRGKYRGSSSSSGEFLTGWIWCEKPHSSYSRSPAENRERFFHRVHFTRIVGFTNFIHETEPTWSSTSSGTGGYHYPNAGKFFFWILCSLLCWITSTEKYLNITNGMKWWKWSVSHPLTTNHSDIYFWCRWPS